MDVHGKKGSVLPGGMSFLPNLPAHLTPTRDALETVEPRSALSPEPLALQVSLALCHFTVSPSLSLGFLSFLFVPLLQCLGASLLTLGSKQSV